MSSLLSRWTGRSEPPEQPAVSPDRPLPEPAYALKRRNSVLAWSASPSLEGIQRELDEQIRAIEEAKRLLEERLSPFQRHIWEQRRNIEQALKQLEARMKPLRQYVEGQTHNMERIGQHLASELRDQFEAFQGFLADQRQIIERAQRYLEEQPRPLAQYLDDQQQAVENIFRDLEERLEPFGRFLKEQQKLLEGLADPRVTEEFEILARYCGERHAALERFATAADFRPQGLFSDLDGIYQKYKAQDGGKSKLLSRVLEQTRQADLRLQDTLKPVPRERQEALPPRADVPS